MPVIQNRLRFSPKKSQPFEIINKSNFIAIFILCWLAVVYNIIEMRNELGKNTTDYSQTFCKLTSMFLGFL